MKNFLAAATCFILFGCGSGIDGTYADGAGFTQYRFEKDGKVYSRTMGMEVEMQYEVDGTTIRLKGPGGVNLILERQNEDTIIGPLGMKLSRKT